MPAITVTEHIDKAVRKIDKSKAIDHWDRNLGRYDAEELMTEVLGRKLTPAILDRVLDATSKKRYQGMVARRVNGEPIPRIKGHYAFRGLDLLIRDGVFVPRASSELLANEAIKALRRRRGQRVAVDVATGAGPVALAVASEVRDADVWGVDISLEAALLGKDNARHLGLRNVHFRAGDLLDALPRRLRGEIDVFTIHPPYVLRGDLKELPREIRAFEPLQSLTDGSDDGLGLVRRLAAESHVWLRPGGVLLVEVGTYLSRRTQATLRAAKLVDVGWTKDDLGVTRVVSGRTPRK
ncbi:MAG: HemK/PrmC family methyltransferase [Candidatus Dormibacteria bacterium]|jgi:release factor glutamine methyltransferase